MKNLSKILVALTLAGSISSCVVVRPGEVGVKRRLGQLSERVYEQGAYPIFPFTTVMLKTPTRTVNMEVNLNLPSKEGLNINSDISILYRIQKEKVPELIETLGNRYETIISSVFRSAAADVCAQYMAKDMHSGKRSEIETTIAAKMNEHLTERGIAIEAVLMKSIQLPPGLYNSIESRMAAEQEVMRMQFLLEAEKLEAQRKVIEAEGDRDAQLILSQGLTPSIIQLRSIEAFLKLAESPNSKVIITEGEAPFLIEGEK